MPDAVGLHACTVHVYYYTDADDAALAEEVGDRAMHPAFWELFQVKLKNLA